MYKAIKNWRDGYNRLLLLAVGGMVITGCFFAFPVFAATSHHYVCADFSLSGSASCSSNQVSVPANGDTAIDSVPNFPISNGTTLYLVASSTVTFGSVHINITGSGGDVLLCTVNSSGGVACQATANATDGLKFNANISNNVVFSNICGSTVSTADAYNCGVTPPPPPPVVLRYFDEIFGAATTTASSSIAIIDNPTQDYFNGLFLFFMVFYGVIWFFKRR